MKARTLSGTILQLLSTQLPHNTSIAETSKNSATLKYKTHLSAGNAKGDDTGRQRVRATQKVMTHILCATVKSEMYKQNVSWTRVRL